MSLETNNRHFLSFNLACKAVLQDIVKYGSDVDSIIDPMSVGSNFGCQVRPTKEIIGYSFSLESPTNRLLSSKLRKINLSFAVANSLWTISGSDELRFINFYNQRGRDFSDDQITLYGAHGKRLFNANGVNQIEAITERLKKDPYSRRTVASVYYPSDNRASSRDIPCPIAIQFLQRDGKLHAITYMRSQSAAMVLPYDIYSFTFLQEVLAVELGAELGTYHHVCGSLHYYLDEEALVKRIITEEDLLTSDPYNLLPAMPRETSPLKMVSKLMAMEEELRTQIQSGRKVSRSQLSGIPEYWQDLLLILVIRLSEKAGMEIQEYLDFLPEYFSTHLESSASK
ncbi:thymidylate synthase [Coleofasciculus sp. H7-2]|uniref:thymidylate synthase n=1 Tax=Coleofasciculus sp. H7-2 TaxID=3351545 RepID=UPI0036700959